MVIYTCTFAFSNVSNHVLLLRKAKPDWQKGLLNGIGGKVEEAKDGFLENVYDATIREFHEETGLWDLDVHPLIYHSMMWPDYLSHTGFPLVYFSAFTMPISAMREAVKLTATADEPCVIINPDESGWRLNAMPNLPFLIEMARCLAVCKSHERKLRQPVVPSPGVWAEFIETGRNEANY